MLKRMLTRMLKMMQCYKKLHQMKFLLNDPDHEMLWFEANKTVGFKTK